jgi:hypothetical protein
MDKREDRGLWKRRMPDSVASLALVLLASGCVWVLLFMPRPVPPTQPPPLVLERDAVVRVLARDRQDAASLRETPVVRQLNALWLDEGGAAVQDFQPARLRSHQLQRQLAELRREQGEHAVGRLRARALMRLAELMEGQDPDAETRAFLGSFVALLHRYQAARDGDVIAPRFVVRTLFAARWNLIHALPITHGFASVELQAYHGWLALHASGAAPRLRALAVEAYAAAGGRWPEAARASLAYLDQRPREALRALDAAYASRPTWRLRNQGIAVRQALGP